MQNSLNQAIQTVLTLGPAGSATDIETALATLAKEAITNEANLPEKLTIQTIRKINAHSESTIEQYWAERLVSASDLTTELQLYPEYAGYRTLISRELKQLEDTGLRLQEDSNVLVIGSGPLPLTAIEIHKQSGAVIDQLDMSEAAIETGRAVSTVFGVQSNYYIADGSHAVFKKKYDLILVAALAGETLAQKQAIIDNAIKYLKPDGRILLRTAVGLRTLFYLGINENDLSAVRLISEYHPHDELISVLIYESS